MSETTHPNLLAIRDFNQEEEWFVSQYHPNGVLHAKPDRFKGNFRDALAAFRPLVDAVAELHAKDIVHRDIKPANVFVAADDTLILGDLGLVFFADDESTRLSATLQNVGSRDWMPPWPMGQRDEDVRKSFDVYSLGKLLWAMVSGKQLLNLWYFDRDENNVERLFPASPYIHFANQIFKRCIVEEESDCLKDANALLEEVDRVLRIIELGADAISDRPTRPCRVCGMGNYTLVVDRDRVDLLNFFSFAGAGNNNFKIFACSHCGHVQMFSFGGAKHPPAWSS